MTLAAVMPTLRPSIWPLSWAARSSQWSARADEAPDTLSASAASSASAVVSRVDRRNSTFNVIVMPLCAIEASAGGWRKGGCFGADPLGFPSSWPGSTRLDPAIHAFWMRLKKDMDARDKHGHGDCRQGIRNLPFVRKVLRTVQPPVQRLEADASGS